MSVSTTAAQLAKRRAREYAELKRLPGGASSVRLADLLRAPGLNLELLVGSDSNEAQLSEAVVLDICADDDLQRLAPGTVVLAAGPPAGGVTAAQRMLVRQLAERGAGALGIAVAGSGGQVPAPVVSQAQAEGLALFSIPPETSCHQVLNFIDGARRAAIDHGDPASAHDYLMDAIRENDPSHAVIRRLGHLMGGAALLFNDGGHLVTATGTAGVPSGDEAWSEIRSRTASPQQFEIGHYHVSSVPIRIDGRVRYWLAVITRASLTSAESSRSIFRTAERLLELLSAARNGADADEQALRSGLLAAALEERDPRRLFEIAHRVTRFGITFAEPCRVLLATLAITNSSRASSASPPVAAVADQLRKTFSDARVPCLLDHHQGEIIALLQGEGHEIDRSVAAFARDGVHVVVGLGRQHQTIEECRPSLQDARLAMLQIERRHGGAVLRIERSDLSRWILGGIAPEQLAPKVSHLLSEIQDKETLYETLTTYLDSDLDLGRTATALHLHVNTVRYRLDKVERLLGRSLRRTATLADVYLAVTAQRSILSAAETR